MLRRLKKEVEKDLPPKKETVVYVGMSKMQKLLYQSILRKDFEAVAGALSFALIRHGWATLAHAASLGF